MRARRSALSRLAASTRFGPRTTRRPFSNRRPRISICRCCWRCGPGSGKATCCGCRGRPMTARISGCRQSKTGARVVIPVGAPLKAALDAATKHGPLILTNSLRRPWTSHGFQTSWRIAASEGRNRRRDIPRSARHRGHAARDGRLHRSRDRHHHRALACATCTRSSTPTICIAMRRSARAQSESSNGKRTFRIRTPNWTPNWTPN